jgi:magnesium-protoporphyrin O-methyltransferase
MADCCSSAESYFNEEYARTELRQYRRGRLDAPTRRVLKALRAQAPDINSMLDIGGGVGIITHEVLRESEATATYVDGSSAHVRAAREEAQQLGHADRVHFIHGDFLDALDDIEPADVVVMHRVVCCYPDAARLLTAAASRARRALVLSYPRDIWLVRAEIALGNWIRRRRPVPFTAYVHPQALLDTTLAAAGPGSNPGQALRRQSRDGTPYWRIDAWVRPRG